MKKSRTAAILACALLIGNLLASCAHTENAAAATDDDTTAAPVSTVDVSPESPPTPQVTPTQAVPPAESAAASSPSFSPAPSASPVEGFVFEEMTYADGSISIHYPQITGVTDKTAEKALNEMISSAALRDVNDLPAGTEYQLEYTVTLNTPAVLSLYYEGYAYVPDTVHPYAFLRAVTIDVAKQELVRLPSLLNASDGVADVIRSGTYSSMSYEMTAEYETAIKENLNVLDEEFWLNELRNADTELSATVSFLTEDALIISVSVPHVMGDHVEIHLPFKDLAGYQTDNAIWLELDK